MDGGARAVMMAGPVPRVRKSNAMEHLYIMIRTTETVRGTRH
jgi:hypothetical protein